MSTKWSDDLISGYLDHELDSDLQSFVENEIANDPAKAELLERLRQQRETTSLLPQFKLQRDLSGAILTKARARAEGTTRNGANSLIGKVATKPSKRHSKSTPRTSAMSTQNWRVAAATLVALAGCLLLTLFVLPSGPNNVARNVAMGEAEAGKSNANERSGTDRQNNLTDDESRQELSEGAAITGDRPRVEMPSKETPLRFDDNGKREADAEMADGATPGNPGAEESISDSGNADSGNAGAGNASGANDDDKTGEFRSAENKASKYEGREGAGKTIEAETDGKDLFALNDLDDSREIDQVITIKMNPEDIREQQVKSTLSELKFSLVGEFDIEGYEALFIDTTVAGLQVLLSRLGGEQKLTIVPAHEDAADWEIQLQALDPDDLNNRSIADGSGNAAPANSQPSENKNQNGVGGDSGNEDQQVQTDGSREFEQAPDSSSGIARRLPSFDLRLNELANDEEPVAENDTPSPATDEQGLRDPSVIAQQGGDHGLPSESDTIMKSDDQKNDETVLGGNEIKQAGKTAEKKTRVLELDQLDQTAKVRSLIMIIPDESVPRAKSQKAEPVESVSELFKRPESDSKTKSKSPRKNQAPIPKK